MGPYLTIDGFARHMGVSRSSVKRWLKDGLPSLKLGARTLRIPLDQALAWLGARAPAPPSGPTVLQAPDPPPRVRKADRYPVRA